MSGPRARDATSPHAFASLSRGSGDAARAANPHRAPIPFPPKLTFAYRRLVRGSPTARHYVGGGFGAAVALASLAALRAHARPVYVRGALEDGGGDLAAGGMVSTFHDAVYVSSAALALGAATDWSLLLLLLFPLYGLVKVYTAVIHPWIVTPTADEEAAHAAAAERRAKAAAKAARGAKAKAQRRA